MAATATPYGLVPVKSLAGTPFAGAMRQYKIASGYTSNIFNGDVVKAVSDGTIDKDTGTATATPVGVFMGVQFTSGSLGYVQNQQYWPASTVAADAWAYVCDDIFAVFQAQAAGSYAQTVLFNNVALVQGAGSTLTGKSGVTLGTTPATTATLPVRIVGFVGGKIETVSPADAFTDTLVIWNFGMSAFMNATGV